MIPLNHNCKAPKDFWIEKAVAKCKNCGHITRIEDYI
jgi:hypothetical protein